MYIILITTHIFFSWLIKYFDRNLWREFQIWITLKTCNNLLNKILVDSVFGTICFEVGLSGEDENRHWMIELTNYLKWINQMEKSIRVQLYNTRWKTHWATVTAGQLNY